MTALRFRPFIAADVRSFRCVSLASGEIRVTPDWTAEPIEPGLVPVGVGTRMETAGEIERVLNAALERTRRKREQDMRRKRND